MGDRHLLIALAAVALMWMFDDLPFARRDAASGTTPRVLWHVDGEGRGTPVADEETVYFLSRHHGVVAIDRLTGHLKWTTGTGGSGATTSGSVLVSSASFVIAGDDDVVALDEGGRVRWRFAPADGSRPGLYLGEATDRRVFAGSPSGRLYAIDSTTGAEVWSAKVADDGDTTVFAPIVYRDVVIAAFTTFAAPPRGGIVVVDGETGRERSRSVFQSATPYQSTGVTGGPLVAGRTLFAVTDDGAVRRWDVETWQSLPALPASGARGLADTEPVRHDFRALAAARGLLFAGSLTGTVVAYDFERGVERWRCTPLESSVAFAMAASADTLYVPYFSGTLIALDAETCRERWRIGSVGSGFAWAPRVAGDRLFVSASRAGYFALGR